MLKVLCVSDKKDTAIDRLAKGVSKYHDNIDYVVVDCHPKRPDQQQLVDFAREAIDADVIDWQYFRTAELLRGMYPWLKDKIQVLTHNNPYSIHESHWNDYDLIVGNNVEVFDNLTEITQRPLLHIPLAVDADFWTFNADWQPNKNVIMVANRIEGKKGILPIAIACNELNLHFILVGSISDGNYFQAIMASGNVEFHEQISDEQLRDLYHNSTLHVANSVDNFETGPLPAIEAMLTGVPVLSRLIGHIPEIYNGENMIINEGSNEDIPHIKELIKDIMFDKKRMAEMRDKAWQSAKGWNYERRAYAYQKAYRQALHPDSKMVSVIVPIFDKPEIIIKCLDAISNQTYKNIETVVADDNSESNEALVRDFAKYINLPVRYLNTSLDDYGLARARNEAVIEATGELVVFCDQRMVMETNAIEQFVKYTAPKKWLYGNKGGGKREFVENFSCVNRSEAIDAGLFNERINLYGGLSQEIRSRTRHQGFQHEYIESAKAVPTGKSSNRNRKRQEIIKMKNRLWKMGLQ